MTDTIKIIVTKTDSFLIHNLLLFCNFIVLLFVSSDSENVNFVLKSVSLIPSFIIIGIAAYLLNDFFDLNTDKIANKPNVAAKGNPIYTLLISLFLFVVGFAPAYFISINAFYILVIQFILLFCYSFFHLKKRGFLGIITDAVYAHVIPVSILLCLLNEETEVAKNQVILLMSIGLLIGIRDILIHQQNDMINDLRSKTKTFVVLHQYLALKLIYVSEILAAILLCCFCLNVYLNSNILFAFLTLLLTVFYVVTYVLKSKKILNGEDYLMRVYIISSSVVFTLWLCFQHKYWVLLLLIHPYFISFIKQIGNRIYLIAKYILKIWIGRLLVQYIPLFVNHILYYVFLLLGRNLKEKPLYSKENEFKLLKQVRSFFAK